MSPSNMSDVSETQPYFTLFISSRRKKEQNTKKGAKIDKHKHMMLSAHSIHLFQFRKIICFKKYIWNERLWPHSRVGHRIKLNLIMDFVPKWFPIRGPKRKINVRLCELFILRISSLRVKIEAYESWEIHTFDVYRLWYIIKLIKQRDLCIFLYSKFLR